MRVLWLAAMLLASVVLSGVARAGGSWLSPTEDSYQPGEEVMAVGYVFADPEEMERTYVARLNMTPVGPVDHQVFDWRELGPVIVQPTELGGYLNARVVLRFQVPAGMGPGVYEVAVRGELDEYLGDLIGMYLYVGVESESETYSWPLNEPLISELPDDAVIMGPGFGTTAAELRAGRYPPNAENFLLNTDTLVLTGMFDEPPIPMEAEQTVEPSVRPFRPHPDRPVSPVTHPVAEPDVQEDTPNDTSAALVAVAIVLVALLIGLSHRGQPRTSPDAVSGATIPADTPGLSPEKGQ